MPIEDLEDLVKAARAVDDAYGPRAEFVLLVNTPEGLMALSPATEERALALVHYWSAHQMGHPN